MLSPLNPSRFLRCKDLGLLSIPRFRLTWKHRRYWGFAAVDFKLRINLLRSVWTLSSITSLKMFASLFALSLCVCLKYSFKSDMYYIILFIELSYYFIYLIICKYYSYSELLRSSSFILISTEYRKKCPIWTPSSKKRFF